MDSNEPEAEAQSSEFCSKNVAGNSEQTPSSSAQKDNDIKTTSVSETPVEDTSIGMSHDNQQSDVPSHNPSEETETKTTNETSSAMEDDSIHDKFDDEPIDIDEILDSLRADSETGTSEDASNVLVEENTKLCAENENIVQEVEGTNVLVSDYDGKEESTSNIQTLKADSNIEKTSESNVVGEVRALISPTSEEKNENLQENPIDLENSVIESDQQDCDASINETVNVLDLFLENQDLFGQVDEDIVEQPKESESESDIQSIDLNVDNRTEVDIQQENIGICATAVENAEQNLDSMKDVSCTDSNIQNDTVEEEKCPDVVPMEIEDIVSEPIEEGNEQTDGIEENKCADVVPLEIENIVNEPSEEGSSQTDIQTDENEIGKCADIIPLDMENIVSEPTKEGEAQTDIQTEVMEESECADIVSSEIENVVSEPTEKSDETTGMRDTKDSENEGNFMENEKVNQENENQTSVNEQVVNEPSKDETPITAQSDVEMDEVEQKKEVEISTPEKSTNESSGENELQSNDLDLLVECEKKNDFVESPTSEIDNVNQNDVDGVKKQPNTFDTESNEEKSIVRKECLNINCPKECEIYIDAPEFIINHFHLSKRPKILHICEQCYDMVTESYAELCAALEDKQPIFLMTPKYNDSVEIIDSSDEEDDADSKSGENVDENSFDAETLSMIENELEAVIEETLRKVDISQQMDWNRQILKQKIEKNEKDCTVMLNEMKTLQSRIDNLYKSTYNFRHNFIEEVQSLDLTTLQPTQICNATYPPVGEIKYDDIQYNTLYYTFRSRMISAWQPCKVVDKVEIDGHTEYVTRFCRKKKDNAAPKNVLRKQLAYGRSPDYRLNVGVRVIALFDSIDSGSTASSKAIRMKNNFYPGVIGEPLSLYTHWRYLVFFDDGWVQYVHHENVRVVCESTENVWELIDEPGTKTFIEDYVKYYRTKRPIVQVRNGQRIQTEFQGKWYDGIVNKIDASLVQIFFEALRRYEWIYKGSTRLFPLYKRLKAATLSANRNEASIEYMQIDDDKEPQRSTEPPVAETTQNTTTTAKATPIQRTFASQAARDTPQQKQREQKRAVATKSTAPQPKPAVQHMNNSTIYVDEDKPKGKVVYYTAKKHLDVKKYIHHECSPVCLIEILHNLSSYSSLSKPLLSGFDRQISKTRFNKKFVVYRAPCGRRIRDMYELHKYLRITKCTLNVDNFTFEPLIHCLAEYVIDSYVLKKPDLSEGIEKMPVQLINCYDNTMPPACKYSAQRIPTEGVDLNTDPEFLCGCDCTDDCLDKTKCACWQLTLQGAKYGNPDTPIHEVGYEYKRLNEAVPTGIYECNAQCKCKASCVNRVVQHPLQLKLQVFKTVNRGWGLRCLNDVPKGSFICCYAGNLLTETAANDAGEDLGDEYFAELDYIEVVENMKEGYEPDVINEDEESSGSDDDFDVEKEFESRNNDSDDEFVARSYSASEDSESRRSYRTRNSVDTQKQSNSASRTPNRENEKRRDRNSSSDDEDDGIRQVKNFMVSNIMPLNNDPDDDKGKSIRAHFGKNEAVYIMDAKKAGNIGRYFNHSCGPNLFVQNVFVDTHDLRFPWVAFFASTHIRAGTELTWNYNYEVGSVPGKVLICQCGDQKCRGRIL